MTKLPSLLLWLCFYSSAAYSQISQIKIVNLRVNNTLPAKIDDWQLTAGSLVLVAQKSPDVQLKEPKLVVQIKSNGAFICGNSVSSASSISSFDVKTFTTSELTGMLNGCKELKDGSYQLCVQFFNLDRIAISNEMCKEFTVQTAKTEDFSSPTLINPENGKAFTQAEIKRPLTFRWTPVVPKPKETVTYRLKVWQLMKGQTGSQAMRTNRPIVEKDVDNTTQAVVTNLYTGPCNPPYLCDFVWNVQAVNKEGKPIGKNNGKSEPYIFNTSADDNINIKIDSVDISCCSNGKQNIYIKISNLLPIYLAQVLTIKYMVNGTGPLTTLIPVVPSLPNTIAANSSQVYTGSINCVDSMTTIKFYVDAIWPTDPLIHNTERALDTLHCACTACDEKHFTLNAPTPSQIGFANNMVSFAQPVTVTTTPAKTIKTIKAELVYFEMVPENNYCIPCNKDAAAYGHFSNGTNSMEWSTVNVPQNFSVTTPQMTPCCSAVFKWCIRYKIEFEDCTTCNKLVCYEKRKEGCDKTANTPK